MRYASPIVRAAWRKSAAASAENWKAFKYSSTLNPGRAVRIAAAYACASSILPVRLDPTFARAHAGLSFTHWQSAFQHWGDRKQHTNRALEIAGRGLVVDEHDPAAHWAMGRALWLNGRHGEAVVELQQSVDLSPNFALGHYAVAFVHSQSGDPLAAIKAADYSRLLSPFDPLLFGILGSRAMAHVRLGQFEEAAAWSVKAAMQPNAHVLILAIAGYGGTPPVHPISGHGRHDEPTFGARPGPVIEPILTRACCDG